MKELAGRFGIHRTTVAEHLRRQAVARRRPGLTDRELDQARTLRMEGWSYQRLGERFGCDAETVRQRLRLDVNT